MTAISSGPYTTLLDATRRCDGAAGDFIGERPVNSVIQPAGLPINTSIIEVLRRPVEFAQYTLGLFGHRLREVRLLISMGRAALACDSAMIDSPFGSMQIELLDRRIWSTRAELAAAIFEYIEAFCNPVRRHSALDYRNPNRLQEISRHHPHGGANTQHQQSGKTEAGHFITHLP